MAQAFTLREVADLIGASVHGDASCVVSRVAKLQEAGPGDISFLSNPRYRKHLQGTRASAVIVTQEDLAACPGNALVCADPYVGFALAAAALNPLPPVKPEIHPTAVVGEDCQIDSSAYIGPYVVIGSQTKIGSRVSLGAHSIVGNRCEIGADSRFVANVTICDDTHIGARVIVHPGAVIGSDGFGLAKHRGQWLKIPQLGRVVIGDDAEIGANTTIDRGALQDTVIGKGVKLDNLIQVAHNVSIGEHTAIAGCAGIAGSSTIGRDCMIGGGVGISGHLTLTDRVIVTGMSLVAQSIDAAGTYSSGVPAMENSKWNRNVIRLKQLEDLARRVKRLETVGVGQGDQRDPSNERNPAAPK